ncbi:MAG: OmpA family protein [Hoeflea sp.]|uniref:OmpA family protein n=1 Tax=Hoeflea sp. TaxID=1940281 RepID=UPI0032EE4A4B
MSFANGVLPLSISTGDAALKVAMTSAVGLIDGDPRGFVVTAKPGGQSDIVEIVYALPALTRFDRFAVPNITETPSPSQTFFKHIEILGAVESVDGPYVTLASAQLGVPPEKGAETELTLSADQPEVLWIKLRLGDGINVERDKTFFEFSEVIGNGTQQVPPMSAGFSGVWKGRGVAIELDQHEASVTGCYDTDGLLNGSVDGNILRATGQNAAGIPSQFILIAAADGSLRGLRSTNGAPFKPYDGEPSDSAPVCLPAEPPALGCGAIIHGIGFDHDSDRIRPQSEPLLAAMYDDLSATGGGKIEIVGHSSSEGAADYNRHLSQRRAEAVVAALVERGLDPSRLSAAGRGEDEPIASNNDEAGRSMNRRVEIRCAD